MRRFVMRFLQLQIAMVLGATVCLVVGGLIRTSSAYAAVYYPGSVLYFLGDIFFLTAPVVVWMVLRGRGPRPSLEVAIAMLVPVAALVFVGELMRAEYLVWMVTAMYPAMTIGMLAYLLHRGNALDPA